MSAKYYYFAVSLPFLEFEVPSEYSLPRFLDDCERLLSPGDLAEMRGALEVWENSDRDVSNPTARAWKNFVRNLRNQAASVRATHARKDPDKYIRGSREVELDIVEAVKLADKSPDPLSGEKILQRLCWRRLDDLAGGHFFDLDFLIIQGLRLQLLARFEKEASVRGGHVFEEYEKSLAGLR